LKQGFECLISIKVGGHADWNITIPGCDRRVGKDTEAPGVWHIKGLIEILKRMVTDPEELETD